MPRCMPVHLSVPEISKALVILLQFSFCSSLWIISIDRSSNLLIVSSATQEETITEFPSSFFHCGHSTFISRIFICLKKPISIFIYIYIFGCARPQLWHANFLLWHAGLSFLTRGQTQAPWIGRMAS